MAMPITTRPDEVDRFSDADHWTHVMASLFEKAIEKAGFEPARPVTQGSHLIHGEIIRQLTTAELVLIDLSSHNPNVFFELGVRTSLNLPVALVRDQHTELPFDTAGINTYTYDCNLHGWEIEAQQKALAEHLRKSVESCHGQNPLWRQFGLSITAQTPDAAESPLEAKVDLLTMQVMQLQNSLARDDHMITDQFFDPSKSWSDHQLSDYSRTPPSFLFRSAVLRAFKDSPDTVQVEVVSPRAAIVRGRVENLRPSVIQRVHELAGRYEVVIDLLTIPSDNTDQERAERGGRSTAILPG